MSGQRLSVQSVKSHAWRRLCFFVGALLLGVGWRQSSGTGLVQTGTEAGTETETQTPRWSPSSFLVS